MSIMHRSSGDDSQIQKIALLGLKNAGKTSIVKTVLSEFQDLTKITPTKGVERNIIKFLGRALYIWDFGGQSRYQNRYFSNSDRHFSSITYVFYVIDSQDIETIDESIEYFKQCYDSTLNNSPEANFHIFFHKMDPEYKGSIDFSEVEKRFLDKIIPLLEEKGSPPPVIFHTSIYDPWSIVSSFTQPFVSNEMLRETIMGALKGICEDFNLNLAMLFTANLYEIGSFHRNLTREELNEALDLIRNDSQSRSSENQFEMLDFGFSTIISHEFNISVSESEYSFYLCLGFSKNISELEKRRIFGEFDRMIGFVSAILRHSEFLSKGSIDIANISL